MFSLSLSSLLLYASAGGGALYRRIPRLAVLFLWGSACLLHALALAAGIPEDQAFAFSFLQTLSLTTLLLNALVVLGSLIRPTMHLGLITIPCAVAVVWIEPESTQASAALSAATLAHVLPSMLAYGLICMAGAQAILLLVKEYSLSPRLLSTRIARNLPPLDRMESLLIEILALGLVLLTVGLALGASMLDFENREVLQKTVFSALAWAILVGLLWGNWRHGWRGRFAAGWTLGGLSLLLAGLLGTKLALEMLPPA